MKFLIFSLTVLSIFHSHSWAKEKFSTIRVKDLAAKIKEDSTQVFIYDANVESTRKAVGIIPGAKLLNSTSDYDISKELPATKSSSLVFYCANEHCTASHTAANRALKAGYTNVSVMVDGIYGWKKAGMKLESISIKDNNNKITNIKSLTPSEVIELSKANDAVIVDVRENEERHQIIPHSLWLPMSDVNVDAKWIQFQKELPKNKTVIFHCAAGIRAKKVAQKLSDLGYKTAFFEGPDQWQNAGLPLEKGPAQ